MRLNRLGYPPGSQLGYQLFRGVITPRPSAALERLRLLHVCATFGCGSCKTGFSGRCHCFGGPFIAWSTACSHANKCQARLSQWNLLVILSIDVAVPFRVSIASNNRLQLRRALRESNGVVVRGCMMKACMCMLLLTSLQSEQCAIKPEQTI